MARLLLVLLLLLAACAPRQSAPGPKAEVRLVPGGRIEGRWMDWRGQRFALPAVPLFVDAAGERFFAAYPFRLLVFGPGGRIGDLPLPGVPRFLHARPVPVVGTDGGVWIEGQSPWQVPAKDARWKGRLYWINGGAHVDAELRFSGRFKAVVADDLKVAFLGEEARFLSGEHFPLPAFKKAELFDDLYLLTEDALLRYSPGGLLLDRRPGRFSDLAVDADGVWVLEDGQVLHLGFNLEETP